MDKNTDCLESCDMFDFMSKYVGLNVLHPGGLKSTNDLLENLQVDKSSNVLDIACSKGINSLMIAKKHGCRVTGIDILEDSINQAIQFAKKNNTDHLVQFKVADA